MQIKEIYDNSKGLLVGLHPATLCVLCTSAQNVYEGEWQYTATGT